MNGHHRIIGRKRPRLLELLEGNAPVPPRHGIKALLKVGVKKKAPVARGVGPQVQRLRVHRKG